MIMSKKNHVCTDAIYQELVQKVSQETLLQRLKEVREEMVNGSRWVY